MLRLLVICSLLSASALAAERPTAEALRKAVEESRAAYLAEHSPTQEQAIAKAQSEVDRLSKIKPAQFKNRSQLKEHAEQLAAAKKELASVKRSYKPPMVEPRLKDMDWDHFQVGQVGHVGRVIRGGVASGEIKVVQVLERGRFLGQHYISIPGRYIGDRPRFDGSPLCLFKGVDTSSFSDGRLVDVEFDAVMTGNFTYETQDGASNTVPVFERFDPDHLERWR